MYKLNWTYLFPILILHNVPYPLSYIKLDCQSHCVCLSPVWFMSDNCAKLVRNIIGKIGKVSPFRIERNQTNNDLTLVPGTRYIVNWAVVITYMYSAAPRWYQVLSQYPWVQLWFTTTITCTGQFYHNHYTLCTRILSFFIWFFLSDISQEEFFTFLTTSSGLMEDMAKPKDSHICPNEDPHFELKIICSDFLGTLLKSASAEMHSEINMS